MKPKNLFLADFETKFKPQFLQFFGQFSRYFVLHSFSYATFSSKLYLKLLSRHKIQQTFNFITSHLLVNSNICAIKPVKLILVRSQTRKTINFLILEQKLIKSKLSFSSLTSVFNQVSHFRFSVLH